MSLLPWIVAITALLVALKQLGFFGKKKDEDE